jgi:hypothetical protein
MTSEGDGTTMAKDTESSEDTSDAQAGELQKLREIEPGVHRHAKAVARDRQAGPKTKLFAKKTKIRLVLRPILRNSPTGKNPPERTD